MIQSECWEKGPIESSKEQASGERVPIDDSGTRPRILTLVITQKQPWTLSSASSPPLETTL